MRLVIDASVTLAWAMPDELDEYAEKAIAIAWDHGATTPAIWLLEVTNSILTNERRGRYGQKESSDIIDDLRTFPWIIDQETTARCIDRTMVLARSHKLTVYDAAYLELALRRNLPLATLDRDLITAAKKEGIYYAI